VILLDSFGKLVANINNIMSSPAGTNYRIAQYDTFRNPEKVLYLQKNLVAKDSLFRGSSFRYNL
jgi:CRISPR-associated protein Cas1